jgi:hypothetical protein
MRSTLLAVALLALAAPLAEPSAAQDKPVVLSGDVPRHGFAGRIGATKERLLKAHGGTKESELAVARGLEWLAKQQQPDGSWAFDGADKDETAAATGLGVLPFLGAGHRHKVGQHQKTVKGGLDWLVKNQTAEGKFTGAKTASGQAIATLAVVDFYGQTKEGPSKRQAQLAVNAIQNAQAADGSWGNPGDAASVGWSVQALKAAQFAGDLVVDREVIAKAAAFLDKAAGAKKAADGDATAIRLWCRAAAGGEIPAGTAEEMLKRAARVGKPPGDTSFYSYSTPLVWYVGGEPWAKWNEGPEVNGKRSGGLRDALVAAQVTKDGATLGSWDPDTSVVGRSYGRLGTTAMCTLMLEVYYRYPPPPRQ